MEPFIFHKRAVLKLSNGVELSKIGKLSINHQGFVTIEDFTFTWPNDSRGQALTDPINIKILIKEVFGDAVFNAVKPLLLIK